MIGFKWTHPLLAALLFAVAMAPCAAAAVDPLYASLTRDFGRLKGDYVYDRWSVAHQILDSMTVPDDNKSLPDGNTLVSGCRAHSCTEKAAAIVASDGKALAAGLINFHCGGSKSPCYKEPRLTIFVKKKNNRPDLIAELKAWAKDAENATITEMIVVP